MDDDDGDSDEGDDSKQRQKINELKVECSAKVRRFGAIDMEVVGCMNPKFVACSAYLINFSAAG